MIHVIVSLLLVATIPDGKSEFTDHQLVHQALFNCGSVRDVEKVDQPFLYWMLDRERHFGVPESLRGLSLAAACNESGFNPDARGDWTRYKSRRGKYRRYARARGIMQLWPWWISKYNINRHDPHQNVNAWLLHMKERLDKTVAKRCPKRWSEKKRWIAAWVQTTRGRAHASNRYRCYQRPSHLKILRRWYRRMRKNEQN